jgi:nucleotide-binding universal stress UspA family protein
MLRSIMVPLDGSRLSEQALAFAADLARERTTQLTLIHVHHPSASHPIVIEGMPVIDAQLRSLAADHERTYLELAAEPLRTRGISVDCRRLEGATAPTLAGYARSHGVDLVVLTTHGRSGFAHFWLGSIAEDLLRIAATPLLLLRPTDSAESPQVPTIQRILVALDGSPNAEAILAPVVDLALACGAAVVLLQVVPEGQTRQMPANALENSELAQQNGDAYLASISGRLSEKHIATERMIVANNHPARAILETADHAAIDLIALATAGRGGRRDAFLGSVADKVLRGARCPLLVARPHAE